MKLFRNLVLLSICLIAVSCKSYQNLSIADKDEVDLVQYSSTSLNPKTRIARTAFEKNLPGELPLPSPENVVLSRILKDYGAVFVARAGAVLPPKIMFESQEDCAIWQEQVPKQQANFGVNIELQKPAMQALLDARREANANGFNFTARGTWAGKRDYKDTVKIWLSRLNPGLNYWVQRKKLSAADAERIRSLKPAAQVEEILRLEERGIYFSKDFSKSVVYSATPPGCSQHLSLLAVDINENSNKAVRSVLAKHGWFQTVVSDSPHFTFLGVAETELPSLGLRKVIKDNRSYWIPE